MMASATELMGAGATLEGKYQIVKPLGEGAMGSVFLARDLTLERLVAIKVLKGEVAGRIEEDARFRQEARVLSRLSHPNIVTVYAYGAVPGGAKYIAMEYVEGQTLAEMIASGARLPTEVICHVVTQVGRALSAAHERGMVHRDVKPGNVLLTSVAGDDHFVKVVDFGLAKILVDGQEEGMGDLALKTAEGMAMGTPAYLSPEQARGDGKIDERSDVYAFGVLACQLLTGALPFESANAQQFLLAHVAHDPRLPSALMAEVEVPEDGLVDQVIARALAKDPEERYQDVLVFAEEFVSAVKAEVMFPQAVNVLSSRDTIDWGNDHDSMPLATSRVAAHSEIRAAVLCVEIDRLMDPEVTIPLQDRMEVLAI
ncbi:MAG: serine/threonine-protein kinase, partial [Myxococcota bacterium]|nr:serine/threonine-protein kinase [Myxococcota bacterium]